MNFIDTLRSVELVLAAGEVPLLVGETGIGKTSLAHQLAEKMGVEMPICASAYAVLYEGQPVELVVEQLMTRSKRREVDESWI